MIVCSLQEPARAGLNTLLRPLILLIAVATLAACSTPNPVAVSGADAYRMMPPAGPDSPSTARYEIGPLDVLSISVFQEKDLSFDEVPVDASGNILFPLIGQVAVAGQTSVQVSQTIGQRLASRFLVNPQVTVLVKSSVSQKVTVDGEVKDPGVYQLQGKTTLVQAVAMAKGTTQIARLDEALIFRTIDGKQQVARFDLKGIRKGQFADPEVLASDTVIVGQSRGKALFRDFVGIAPALASGFVAVSQLQRN